MGQVEHSYDYRNLSSEFSLPALTKCIKGLPAQLGNSSTAVLIMAGIQLFCFSLYLHLLLHMEADHKHFSSVKTE